MRKAAAATLCVWLVIAPAARAETVYVIEQLMVGVVSAPGGAGERVATVKSGDRLELIERQNDQAHVRLASGAEGWIKASYLSSERPLQQRLSERAAEVDKLKADVSRLESELAAARVASTPAPAPRAAIPSNSSPRSDPVHPASPLPTLSRPNEATSPRDAEGLLARRAQSAAHPSWLWVLAAATLMLLVGFGLGWRTLDRRIRRKYGGLRIY